MKRALFVLAACLLAPSTSEAATCSQVTFSWDGLSRFYILCTPSPLPTTAMPVVLDFHGGGGGPAGRYQNSGWKELVDTKKFVAVFMNGCTKTTPRDCVGPTGDFTWNTYKPDESYSWNDVTYSTAVIDRLSSVHGLNVDSSKVYASGFSLGAVFTYTLACHTTNKIRAIGSVAGTHVELGCTTGSRFGVYQVTGLMDRNIPWDGCRSSTESASCPLALCENSNNYWPGVRTGGTCSGIYDAMGVQALASVKMGCFGSALETCNEWVPNTNEAGCTRKSNCTDRDVTWTNVFNAGHSWDECGAALGGMASWLWNRFTDTP